MDNNQINLSKDQAINNLLSLTFVMEEVSNSVDSFLGDHKYYEEAINKDIIYNHLEKLQERYENNGLLFDQIATKIKPDTWFKVHEDFAKNINYELESIPILRAKNEYYIGFRLNEPSAMKVVVSEATRVDYLINRSIDQWIQESPDKERHDIEHIAKQRDLQYQSAKIFYLKNDYPYKIPNLIADGLYGALNKALSKNHGFMLTKKELKKLHCELKSTKKKGVSLK